MSCLLTTITSPTWTTTSLLSTLPRLLTKTPSMNFPRVTPGSPAPRSASPTILSNLRRFRSRPGSSSSFASTSSLTSYKSAPAEPELSFTGPSAAGTPSDLDSDDEEYIHFPNGAFAEPVLPPCTPPRTTSAISAAAAAYGVSPSPSRGRTNSIASISGSPHRSNSGRRVVPPRMHMWREHSPEVWEADSISGVRRRNSTNAKFTTRASEERGQRYYHGSGYGSTASSVSSASGYLISHYASSEASKKKDSKRVRFSLPA